VREAAPAVSGTTRAHATWIDPAGGDHSASEDDEQAAKPANSRTFRTSRTVHAEGDPLVRAPPAVPSALHADEREWLNQVERFFAKITTQRIRRGTFENVRALETAIDG
jgi:hypothetical protein